MRHAAGKVAGAWLAGLLLSVSLAQASTIRIMPPNNAKFVVGQRFDIRVEATSETGPAPSGLRVYINGDEITKRNILDPGSNGEKGYGGTGATSALLSPRDRASAAPANTSNFLFRDFAFSRAGHFVLEARTDDGEVVRVTLFAEEWRGPGHRGGVKNIILLLGDGMGAANRTAARVLARGYTQGKPNGLLAMDTMETTGMVMTSSLNALITDSAPGMAAYVSGNKSNNNQEGVFPDNTLQDPFDNPRVEYLGEILRRYRGPGFNVGIVSTADLTDATPAANAVHTANRSAGPAIANRYLDERDRNGVTVLLGGGSSRFVPGSSQPRNLVAEFQAAGYHYVQNGTGLQALSGQPSVQKLLGLFHPGNMSVAFDKIGQHAGYSLEMTLPANASLRDQPMLDDMTKAALEVLARTSPEGFYLMVEGASIDKRAHDEDAERTMWDTIEFDNAVAVALAFAEATNSDRNPQNDTLVIVTADHECAGFTLLGVGNERYYPPSVGQALRDYAATLRFQTVQQLELFPNYVQGPGGYPVDPDPTRKLIINWGAGPDRYENFISNRFQRAASVVQGGVAVANEDRDGPGMNTDTTTVNGQPIPGFLVPGVMENGANADPSAPADTSSQPVNFSDHTASDIPLSASGRGAWLFTGTFDNTETFFKMMKLAGGAVGPRP
jgi:alkaline phosphatase